MYMSSQIFQHADAFPDSLTHVPDLKQSWKIISLLDLVEVKRSFGNVDGAQIYDIVRRAEIQQFACILRIDKPSLPEVLDEPCALFVHVAAE